MILKSIEVTDMVMDMVMDMVTDMAMAMVMEAMVVDIMKMRESQNQIIK